MEHEVRNVKFGIGTIGGQDPNIEVFPGDQVAVTRAIFDYRGPGGIVHLCWGLKAGTGDFNNGANLAPQGYFASQPITVPQAQNFQTIQANTVRVVLDIVPEIPAGRTYDAYKWLALQPTARQDQFLHGNNIDDDRHVVIVRPPNHEVSNLDVFYELV